MTYMVRGAARGSLLLSTLAGVAHHFPTRHAKRATGERDMDDTEQLEEGPPWCAEQDAARAHAENLKDEVQGRSASSRAFDERTACGGLLALAALVAIALALVVLA